MKRHFGTTLLANDPTNSSHSKTSALSRRSGFHRWFGICLTSGVIAALFGRVQADDSDTFYGVVAGYNVMGVDDSGFGFGALQYWEPLTKSWCTAAGSGALVSSTGYNCTIVGKDATGVFDDNTVVGASAGNAPWDPELGVARTTAIGSHTLGWTTGSESTATGYAAVRITDGGWDNTGNGYLAFGSCPDCSLIIYGRNNTATGALSIGVDTDGLVGEPFQSENTANGAGALQYCTNGSYNTAIGVGAIYSGASQAGYSNTADGWNALLNNYASANVASGYVALSRNTTGATNTAFGISSLLANTTGSTNIALGDAAGASLTTGSNNIDIGNPGVAAESNTIRVGTKSQTVTNITGIRGTTVPGGIAVMIDANGRLGTTTSSAHFKEKIKPMAKNSEALYSLRPVTFRYKKELDPQGTPQVGLVAEEVAKVDPDLVVCDEQGNPYTVRYDAVNAMLLNEFLKQQRRVEGQAQLNQKQLAINKELQSTLARQDATLDAIASQVTLTNE